MRRASCMLVPLSSQQVEASGAYIVPIGIDLQRRKLLFTPSFHDGSRRKGYRRRMESPEAAWS